MSHRTDGAEIWARKLLEQIIERDKRNRDALPGSVMHHIKVARRILIKLQKKRRKHSGRKSCDRFYYLNTKNPSYLLK